MKLSIESLYPAIIIFLMGTFFLALAVALDYNEVDSYHCSLADAKPSIAMVWQIYELDDYSKI